MLKERIITGALHSNASNDRVSFDCAWGMINKLRKLSCRLKWPLDEKKASFFRVALSFKAVTHTF